MKNSLKYFIEYIRKIYLKNEAMGQYNLIYKTILPEVKEEYEMGSKSNI